MDQADIAHQLARTSKRLSTPTSVAKLTATITSTRRSVCRARMTGARDQFGTNSSITVEAIYRRPNTSKPAPDHGPAPSLRMKELVEAAQRASDFRLHPLGFFYLQDAVGEGRTRRVHVWLTDGPDRPENDRTSIRSTLRP